MTYIAHPREFRQLAEAREALFAPHPGDARFDPDFKVTYRCSKCGKLGFGPRRYLREAIEEHQQTCSARLTKENEPFEMRLVYPKQ
jgi:hypothetical protein